MHQEEYMVLYNDLDRYATYKARRLVYDKSQQLEAVDEAMAKFVDNAGFTQEGDELLSPIGDIKDLRAWGKEVIRNYLRNYAKRKHDVTPIMLVQKDYDLLGIQDGFHGYEVK